MATEPFDVLQVTDANGWVLLPLKVPVATSCSEEPDRDRGIEQAYRDRERPGGTSVAG